MKLLDEDCGCDDDYFSIINNSPLLNGNQETNFNPSNNNVVNQPLTKPIVFNKNNNNNTINLIPKIELDVMKKNNNTNNKINDNNINMNNLQLDLTSMNQQAMNNASMNQQAMNNASMNQQAMNNAPMNQQAMNNAPMNQQAMNNHVMTNPNSLNSMNNINTTQELVYMNDNANNVNANANSDKKFKNMITTINYIFMVVLALALNDVSKYYINRAIKSQNGTHKYYLYYILGLVIIVYLFSRTINKLY
jgi:hypothetical protein